MENQDKIILKDDSLFWTSAAYRKQLLLSGVDITKYTNPDGTKSVTGWDNGGTVITQNKNKAGVKAYKLKLD
jgi:hypothetical protein